MESFNYLVNTAGDFASSAADRVAQAASWEEVVQLKSEQGRQLTAAVVAVQSLFIWVREDCKGDPIPEDFILLKRIEQNINNNASPTATDINAFFKLSAALVQLGLSQHNENPKQDQGLRSALDQALRFLVALGNITSLEKVNLLLQKPTSDDIVDIYTYFQAASEYLKNLNADEAVSISAKSVAMFSGAIQAQAQAQVEAKARATTQAANSTPKTPHLLLTLLALAMITVGIALPLAVAVPGLIILSTGISIGVLGLTLLTFNTIDYATGGKINRALSAALAIDKVPLHLNPVLQAWQMSLYVIVPGFTAGLIVFALALLIPPLIPATMIFVSSAGVSHLVASVTLGCVVSLTITTVCAIAYHHQHHQKEGEGGLGLTGVEPAPKKPADMPDAQPGKASPLPGAPNSSVNHDADHPDPSNPELGRE